MAESNSLALATELRDACTGHPVASIRWPHRLLHRAADEIERLQALENGPAGLADANSKPPAPSSQSERIAVQAPELPADEAERFDQDNKEIIRLHLRGLLTDAERDRAITRTTKAIRKAISLPKENDRG